MKKLIVSIFTLLCVIILFASLALSDEWNGVDALPQGYILCESLSLREKANANAKVVNEIPYGDAFAILGDVSDFWLPVVYKGQEGYVRSDYVLVEPMWYTTAEETPVYAIPSNESKRVGLLPAGNKYMIIAEYDNFYAISLRSASGFILKE